MPAGQRNNSQMNFLIPTIKRCLFPGSLNNQYFYILDTILSYSNDSTVLLQNRTQTMIGQVKVKASSKDQLKADPK